MKVDLKNNYHVIIGAIMILIFIMVGWSAYHAFIDTFYTKAFIRLGVSNCQRISVLEKYSYGYKDADLLPNECPKIEEFLENEK
jgi:hypothetical protein